MARKAIVDKDVILSLLKEGETTQKIADRFSVSRQAIDLHRKDFINRGLLEDKRAARTRHHDTIVRSSNGESDHRQPVLITEHHYSFKDTETLDTHIDLLISAFSALKRVPQLEAELATYRRENDRIKKELDRLKNVESKRLEQENRWMLIQTDPNGDIVS